MAHSKQYRAMIYTAVGTIHFYRKDFVPSEEGSTYGIIVENNKVLAERVREEIRNIFGYEITDMQIARAFDAYAAEGQSVAYTTAYIPKVA